MLYIHTQVQQLDWGQFLTGSACVCMCCRPLQCIGIAGLFLAVTFVARVFAGSESKRGCVWGVCKGVVRGIVAGQFAGALLAKALLAICRGIACRVICFPGVFAMVGVY